MNAVIAEPARPTSSAPTRDTTVVLLGTGGVGRALLRLLTTPAAGRLRLVAAANSRAQWIMAGARCKASAADVLHVGGDPRDNNVLLATLDSFGGRRVIVDATASHRVAAQHARWLADGYHVVTANKLVAGGSLHGWRALQAAHRYSGSCYGMSATVGAGLPVISTLRRLHECGDRLVNLEGVFSGSLSWLFSHYTGRIPFSILLQEACELGYTEPDPRADLSGVDVARKLLIAARAAGFDLGIDDVCVENLVPRALRDVDTKTFLAHADELDAVLLDRLAAGQASGGSLRHIARLDGNGHASVGLAVVPPDHPVMHLVGTDNQFALTTTRYAVRPLVIQGPGAGVEVTAQALLADILATP